MLSWGSLLIATILDTKDIMGDLSGGDAVSRTGPLYHLDQPMLLSHIHFFPHDLMISVWGLDFFFFSNGMFYCTGTLIIQGEPQPLKPFFQVPSQILFLRETVCCRFIHPLHYPSSLQTTLAQTKILLFILFSSLLFANSVMFSNYFLHVHLLCSDQLFTTYQSETGHHNCLSTYYVPHPMLGASYVVSFHPYNTPWS